MRRKKTITILFDYLSCPIWAEYYDEETDTEYTGVKVVDDDEEVKRIVAEIESLFNPYYMFNVDDQPVVFNYEQEKKDKDKMLNLLGKLNRRLEEINDGSFTVVDKETPRVMNL